MSKIEDLSKHRKQQPKEDAVNVFFGVVAATLPGNAEPQAFSQAILNMIGSQVQEAAKSIQGPVRVVSASHSVAAGQLVGTKMITVAVVCERVRL